MEVKKSLEFSKMGDFLRDFTRSDEEFKNSQDEVFPDGIPRVGAPSRSASKQPALGDRTYALETGDTELKELDPRCRPSSTASAPPYKAPS